jgi:hypothetical protein
MHRLGWLLVVVGATALASCGKQNAFTIPICPDSSNCHCDQPGNNCVCAVAGWVVCNDVCVDPKLDPNNCGACGNSCSGVCMGGACVASCSGTFSTCGNRCVDAAAMNDPWNCGFCGTVCSDGVCMAGACTSSLPTAGGGGGGGGGGMTCTDKTETYCDGSCVQTNGSDRFNCGGCNSYCSGDCNRGVCCNFINGKFCNGVCTDTDNDANNCGSCGNVCANSCLAGFCQ